MAEILFPSELPRPNQSQYTIDYLTGAISTSMENGKSFRRRVFVGSEDVIKVSWTFDYQKNHLLIFKWFVLEVLKDATKTFSMDYWSGGGILSGVFAFANSSTPFTLDGVEGLNTFVSAELKVIERGVSSYYIRALSLLSGVSEDDIKTAAEDFLTYMNGDYVANDRWDVPPR